MSPTDRGGPPGDVVVVGPGAMGCLLAARLSLAGHSVLLLDHDPARAARLARDGLALTDPQGGARLRATVRCTTPPLEAPPELALVCVKARSTRKALAPLVGGTGTVALLQNGVGRFAAAGEFLGAPERVVGLLSTEGATLTDEGAVRHTGCGRTHVGALRPEQRSRAECVRALLASAGLEASVVDDLERAEWEKATVNAAINALCALLDCPNGALLELPTAAELADRAAAETARVARARGVDGPWTEEQAQARWRAVAQATRRNVCSALADLRRGRATEVFAINGAVARAARELGLTADTNETLDLLVAAREAQLRAR
ncbi:MAG: 2-dehydropantoate 2-reductase [Planctomycetota bacterium]|nr:MAG: 2-dehydropantoate 2-reductase [Planctomycetota bacterium]